MKIDFIFDLASPNAYFCHKVLPEFQEQNKLAVNYVPCLLGGIFKATGNQPPWMAFAGVENKMKYMLTEMQRFISRHNLLEYKMNSHFPLNTLQLMRMLAAIEDAPLMLKVTDELFKGIWEKDLKLDNEEVLKKLLLSLGVDANNLIGLAQLQTSKDKLLQNTSAAIDAGIFGIPTFKVGNEIFFGKEALLEIPKYLETVNL
ncbi:MAG: 2-hydroxychromene-2-carboxylate isomerase [Gammaproteobacteria bacterium]|jgi:2-hydroxychromene-2-carboxylate isomerase